MRYLIVALIGYLFGTWNTAWFLSRQKRVDLRTHGSGNLGASNTVTLLGWKLGAIVAAMDMAKAVFAVWLARYLFPNLPYVEAVAGVSAVLGHIFPFYLRFRGGKGFASFIGMTIALNWKLAIVVALLIIAVTVITDYIVCGTVSACFVVPAYLGHASGSIWLLMILSVASVVILVKHRENYPRILNGTELGLRSALRGENKIKR